MVEDLIADARADAVDISVRSYQLDLGLLVSEVAESNRKLAAARTRKCTSRRRRGFASRGDTERLREAVDNLVSNAVKYSPLGGRIAVTAGREGGEAVRPRRRPGARAFRRRTTTAFSAASSGFPPSRPAAKARPGLGLSIAKRIIDLHKGRIFVESPGRAGGAVFAIALPLLDETDC